MLPLLKQRYLIIDELGRGGMGVVYKAQDMQLGNRLVAVKEMSQHGLSPQETITAVKGFQREAEMLAGLMHPNLPSIHEHFEEAGRWYLVMEFIVGQTLEEYAKARGGWLPVKEVLDIGLQLCAVLNYLHTRQPPIIFRDLKPLNIMRAPDGHLYLIDFGIARHFKTGQAKDTSLALSVGYAAPEQYPKLHTQTTPRSDIYGLGATLHQLLTGNDPSANTPTLFDFPPLKLHGQPAPADLEPLILQMVEKAAERRPASVAEIRRRLQHIANQEAMRQGNSSTSRGSSITTKRQQEASPASPKGVKHSQQSLSRRTVLIGGSSLLALAAAGGAMWWLLSPHPVYTCDGIAPVAWSPDGKYLVSGAGIAHAQAILWNAANGDKIWTHGNGTEAAYSLAWSPDGKRIACGGDKIVEIWDATNGQNVAIYRKHADQVGSVTWSPDGKYIASASVDSTVQIWDVADGNSVLKYSQVGEGQVAWSPNGKYIASSVNFVKFLADASSNSFVRVWDATNGNTIYTYHSQSGEIDGGLAWSPDGSRIASSSGLPGPFTVQVWDAMNGGNIFNYRGHSSVIGDIAWSLDGKRIASIDDNTVQVWNAVDGSDIHIFNIDDKDNVVLSVACSPDGKHIASAAEGLQVWQVE